MSSYTPGPHDRISLDPPADPRCPNKLDEIVATGVTVHIEAMGWHDYWAAISLPDGRSIDLYLENVCITETDQWPVASQVGEQLLMCPVEWDDTGISAHHHRCHVDKPDHLVHRCSCGKGAPARALREGEK